MVAPDYDSFSESGKLRPGVLRGGADLRAGSNNGKLLRAKRAISSGVRALR